MCFILSSQELKTSQASEILLTKADAERKVGNVLPRCRRPHWRMQVTVWTSRVGGVGGRSREQRRGFPPQTLEEDGDFLF
jgi:hypothetical protein